jgi:hypothetical protein
MGREPPPYESAPQFRPPNSRGNHRYGSPTSSKMVLRVLSSGKGCGAIFPRSRDAIVRLNFVDQELRSGILGSCKNWSGDGDREFGFLKCRCRRERGRSLLLLNKCSLIWMLICLFVLACSSTGKLIDPKGSESLTTSKPKTPTTKLSAVFCLNPSPSHLAPS